MTTGILSPLVVPGSTEWLTTMSASKIAAVVGLSPFESPFSLWHRMAGTIPPEPENTATRRGHYLEPAIAAWFADQHPDWTVETTGTWAHADRPWQTASPDRLVHKPDQPSALLEIKSSSQHGEWGTPGTDEIPLYYRAQVQWQMDTVGAQVCHVAVLGAYLEFAEYVVHYDPDDAAFLREQATAFLRSLPGGPAEQPPALDGTNSTYEAVRALHPDIEDRDVEIDDDLALRYQDAVAADTAATTELKAAKSLLLNAMGTARRATHQTHPVATRRPSRGGAVALYPTRSTP